MATQFNTLVFICIQLIFIVTSGTSVTLTGSANYAVLDQTFRFTCTLSNDSSTEGILTFGKDYEVFSCAVIVSSASSNPCTQASSGTDYTCGCVSGQTGVYYINITRVNVTQDEGTWRCFRLSTNSNNITLPVYFGPVGVIITGNQQTNAPDVLTLTCTTTDRVNPEPTLTWRNSTDGAVLSGSSSAQVGSPQDGSFVYRSTLSIFTRWYQDGDSLVCEGRNSRVQSLPAVTDSEVLDITYTPVSKPDISGLPTSPVYEGDTLTLTCRVSGGKPLVTNVTLTCPGGHQNSSTRTEGTNTRLASLIFPAPRQLRSEPCRCSAVHTTGRYQLTAEVTKDDVYYPPSIQRLSLSRSLPWLAGRSENLTCELSNEGHPSATYVWYQNSQRQTDQTGVSLELSPVSYTDNGIAIQCQAENQFTVHKNTAVKSSTQTLNVYYAPRVSTTPANSVTTKAPRVSTSPANSVTTKEGDSLTVECTADSNPDPLNYQWTHESVNRLSGHQLDIADLDRSDHGDYRCTVTTQAGSYGDLSGTSTLQVVVNFSPDLRVTNVTETEKQRATVTCSADGRPESLTFFPFLHTWKGHVIRHVTGQKTGGGREYQKVFPSSNYQDSGMYMCAVGNGVPDRQGELVHKANISVQIDAPPKLTADQEMETSVGAEVRENITLFRTFYSRTSITSHRWSREGRALNNSQMSPSPVQLNIHEVLVQDEGFNISLNVGAFDNELDAGEYELEVCNKQGCLTAKINLTPAGPPSKPTDLKVLNTTETSVFLSWRAGFPGGPYTQKFVVEYRTEGGAWQEFWDPVRGEEGETVVIEVTGLSQDTRYEFRVFARNSRENKNRSEYSASLEKTTKGHPNSNSSSLAGPVAGAVIGVLLLVGVLAAVFFLYRRGYRCPVKKQGESNREDNTTYAHLGNKAPPVYADLRLYENTTNHETSNDEGCMGNAAKKYEDISLHTYANTKTSPHDPAYVNAGFT